MTLHLKLVNIRYLNVEHKCRVDVPLFVIRVSLRHIGIVPTSVFLQRERENKIERERERPPLLTLSFPLPPLTSQI